MIPVILGGMALVAGGKKAIDYLKKSNKERLEKLAQMEEERRIAIENQIAAEKEILRGELLAQKAKEWKEKRELIAYIKEAITGNRDGLECVPLEPVINEEELNQEVELAHLKFKEEETREYQRRKLIASVDALIVRKHQVFAAEGKQDKYGDIVDLVKEIRDYTDESSYLDPWTEYTQQHHNY